MNIAVINLKCNSNCLGNPNVIYIGRGNSELPASLLANPYKIGVAGNRNEVIQKYKRLLWHSVKTALEQQVYDARYNEILRLIKLSQIHPIIQLACWCKPLPCHGDVIVACINWLNQFRR